jgi:hypothetical protein
VNGVMPVRSELVGLLVRLDVDHGAAGTDTPWPQWYAERVIAHLAT